MTTRPLLRALCAFTLFATGPASAAEFCVDTALELDAAFEHFIDQNEDTVIRIAQGNYGIQDFVWQHDSDLTLVGGYSDGSCTNRTYDPSVTVLRPAISDRIDIAAKNLSIGSITFDELDAEAWFEAGGTAFSNGVLRLTRTRIEGPAPDGVHLLGEEVYLNEAIVSGSGSDDAFTFRCALNIEGMDDSDDVVSIQHSTIANNPGSGVCIGYPLPVDDLGFAVWIDNNILYGSAMDLEVSATSRYVIRNNIVGGFIGQFGAQDPGASGGTITADPLFANAAAGDFRLRDASPAINSGITATFDGIPQFDVVGNPRWVGPTPDRGAYESFIDGTEVLTVTDNGDIDAPGTLRWAINQANLNQNHSKIRFNMPGVCPRVIILDGELPDIVTPISIEGYTQPGSSPNSGGFLNGGATDATICVRLVANANNYGLRVPLAAGGNGQLNVSGLSLGGFLQAAISIEAGIGSNIWGNDIHTGQPIGIFVNGSADGTRIGGPDPAQVNVIRSSGYNVALNPPSVRATVENNLIGLNPDGNSTANGNGVGVGISGNDNTVRGNAISGNSSGIAIFDGDRNNISGNVFGRKVGFAGLCGLPPLPPCGVDRDLANSSHGVLIQGDANDNAMQGNTIANSAGAGIRVTSGQRNLFVANRIWNSAEFGADLGNFGHEINDNDGAPSEATQANRGLNSPRIATHGARGGTHSGTVEGTLATTNGAYLMHAYASSTCDGDQGQAQWLIGIGAADITNAPAGDNGSAAYSIPVASPNPGVPLTNMFVTVLATEIGGAGHGNTSELSSCRVYEFSDVIFADGFDG